MCAPWRPPFTAASEGGAGTLRCSVTRQPLKDPQNVSPFFIARQTSEWVVNDELTILSVPIPHKGWINVRRGCSLRDGDAFCTAQLATGHVEGPSGDLGNTRESVASLPSLETVVR